MNALMEYILTHLVSGAVLLPLVGAAIVFALPARAARGSRAVALAFCLASLATSLIILFRVQGTGEIELIDVLPWISSLGISYRVGVDGVSALMLSLVSFTAASSVLASWNDGRAGGKAYHVALLTGLCGLTGLFVSIDAFLFMVFWCVAMASFCAMIGMGGERSAIKAALAFAIFAAISGAAMFVSMAYAAKSAGSFDILRWFSHRYGVNEQIWLFGGLALAFGIILPLAGLHVWLRDSVMDSKAGTTMMLLGAVVKVGAYGFFRIAMPLAPAAVSYFSTAILVFAVAGALYGAMLVIAGRDFKSVITAITISQMGLVLLGLASLQDYAAAGAVLLMAAHGVALCGIVLLAGSLSSEAGDVAFRDFSGLAGRAPIAAFLMALFSLALAGMPGLAGFAGESLLLMGSFQTRTAYSVAGLSAAALLACALAIKVAGSLFGEAADDEGRLKGVHGWRLATLAVIATVVVGMGVWPGWLAGKVWRSSQAFVKLSKRVEMIVPAAAGEAGSSVVRSDGDDA